MVEPQTERSRALVDTALSSRRIAHWLFAHRAEPTSRTCAVNSCCRAFRIPLSASPVLTKAWSKQNSSVPRRELPLGPGCPQSRLGCLGTLAKAAHDGQPARARGPIEDVGALARVRTNSGAAVRSRSAAPSPTLRPHRSGCSWSAALQGKRVPLTAQRTRQRPPGRLRLEAALFRGDSCTGERP
jgi:hypothetical protein